MTWLTDTHCHLNLNIFQDCLDPVLARAWEGGIGRILIPGIDIESSRAAVALAERHENLYAAVGVHPGDASTWQSGTLDSLRELAQHPKVVAIGEIGLDYYRDKAPRSQQRDVFRAQLVLAAEIGLPVIIHNRESMDDLWADLSEWHAHLSQHSSMLAEHPGVLHSYDDTLEMAQRAIASGFFIGVSGPVTFKNAVAHQNLVSALPLEHLLIETDTPFLTPHPYRGRWPNEPAYVRYVAEKIAELHHKPLDTVTQITWNNATQLFRWRTNS